MNRTPLARRTQIINCLVEGSSIRSTERMTNTHRDTIMRLMVEVGTGCAKIANEQMRDLPCQRIQVDEVHSFVGKKQMRLTDDDDFREKGDTWTWVAIDPDTKLIPSYHVGKRQYADAVTFLNDLSGRLANRVQLSSDGLKSYVRAVEKVFGADIDYGQIVKFYDKEPIGPGRYAPPRVTGVERTAVAGSPDPAHISTSIVESQNLTMRQSIRRLTRLTTGYSKKLENHKAATALHFGHYNLCRVHSSLRVTPAMAANVTDRIWPLEELVDRTSR
jgi:IS1 family transposase